MTMPEMRPSTRALYVISIAAELAGVHPQTLRIYERKGLLDPSRTDGGARRYSDADIAQMQRILDLTNAGVNLEGVRRILELEAKVARLESDLDQARTEATARIAETHRQYRRDLVPLRAEIVPVNVRRAPLRSLCGCHRPGTPSTTRMTLSEDGRCPGAADQRRERPRRPQMRSATMQAASVPPRGRSVSRDRRLR